MSDLSESKVTAAVDPAWKALYRAGGISALIGGGFFVISFPFLLLLLPPQAPGSSVFFLKYVADHRLGFLYLNIMLSVLLIFSIPAVLALYASLKEVNKNYMLIATVLFLVGVIVNLAGNNSLYVLELAEKYAAATSDAERAIYVAIPTVSPSVGSRLVEFFLAAGTIITGLLMLKSVFKKWMGYFAIVTGVTSIPFVPFFPLLSIWFILVGSKLYKLGGT